MSLDLGLILGAICLILFIHRPENKYVALRIMLIILVFLAENFLVYAFSDTEDMQAASIVYTVGLLLTTFIAIGIPLIIELRERNRSHPPASRRPVLTRHPLECFLFLIFTSAPPVGGDGRLAGFLFTAPIDTLLEKLISNSLY